MKKKLYRSKNKMICGVCAGLADYFEIDPTIVRVVYAALGVFTAVAPLLILYIVLAVIMPMEEDDTFVG